jgi:eukaryotic-like serine/threonine-protein kinase
MSLSPGDRLGPYSIVEPLGAGGMGQVYRAHDARLGRDVALKIMHRPTDPEALARFIREARAAGGLNHPNIVSVFDVDTENGIPYVVSEVLEGETLRARLDRGMVPYRKAIDCGVQIAQALDAAHARGICHRDVKPANVFITSDGRVKLLDFGIAKLTEHEARAAAHESTVEQSQAGMIRGTAGYMSPEQVLGETVDHRTDIFALGAVLYELLTGARAFHRASTVQTMTAVLQEDPADPLSLNPRLPPAAVTLVLRCLEKNKEERFQSARDLAFDLRQLRESTASTGAVAGPSPTFRRRLRAAVLAAIVLAQAGAIALLLSRPRPVPSFEQLSFRRTRIGGARFESSAGQAVVYSEAREGNVTDVWRIHLADGPSFGPPNHPGGGDVLAARAGRIAMSRNRHFMLGERFVGTLALAPLGGGSPHEVAHNIEDADWDPGGTQLAVAQSSGDVAGQTRIEYPLGTPLYTSGGSIRFLRFSPDGERIAFVEDMTRRGVAGRVAVVDRKGTVTTLTDNWQSVRGLSWSPRGDEIWFTAGATRSNRVLRAVNLKQQQRVIFEAPGSLTLWDVAADGRVLITRDEERRAVVGLAPGSSMERDLSWLDDSGVADLSADGRLMLGRDRSVYVRPMDGSQPQFLELKGGFADALTADGKLAIGTSGEGRLVVIPTGVGQPKVLPAHDIVRYNGVRWFPDASRILITGAKANEELRSYVQDLNGGAPQPITREGTWGLSISPGGDTIAAVTAQQPITLWSVAGKLLQAVNGSLPEDRPVAWSADARSLWIFRRGEIPAHVYKLDLATGKREIWKTLVPPDAAGVYSVIEFQITPKGDAYVYSYTRILSQLYLVRGLK